MVVVIAGPLLLPLLLPLLPLLLVLALLTEPKPLPDAGGPAAMVAPLAAREAAAEGRCGGGASATARMARGAGPSTREAIVEAAMARTCGRRHDWLCTGGVRDWGMEQDEEKEPWHRPEIFRSLHP